MLKSSTLISFLLISYLCNAQLSNWGDLHLVVGDTFKVAGALQNNVGSDIKLDGVLLLHGNLRNSGTFDQDTGKVVLQGNGTQSLSGNITYYVLELDNNNGAEIINGMQNVRKNLSIKSGTFVTNDSLTILSNSLLTGRIGEIPTGSDVVGDVIVQRYVNMGTTGFHMLGSPVDAVTLEDWNDDFITSGFPGSDFPSFWGNIYSYDESVLGGLSDGYNLPNNITTAIPIGQGFWVYMSAPTLIDVKGPVNKFTQTLPVSNTYLIVPRTSDGWNMVSNPYPSTIDWDASGWTKTNIDDAIYTYDPDAAVYTSYVAGVGTNGGTKYISSSQAFWVKASGFFSPNLELTESVKSDVDVQFYRLKNNFDSLSIIRISIHKEGEKKSDETVIRLANGTKIDWESGFDAYKLEDTASMTPYIATVIDTPLDLSINSIPTILSGTNIPLRVKTKSTGTHIINVKVEQIPNHMNCLIMEDLYTGRVVDLKEPIEYKFILSDTTILPRFLIHANPYVDLGNDTSIRENEVYRIKGPEGYHKYTWSTGSHDSYIDVSAPGHYWLEVENKIGCTARDSILVADSIDINDSELPEGIKIYPNPTTGKLYISGCPQTSEMNMMIFDALGSNLFDATIYPKKDLIELDLSSYLPGMYYIKFQSKLCNGTYKVHLINRN